MPRDPLRDILSAYIAAEAQFTIVRSELGKPALQGGKPPRFSVSHTGALTLVGVGEFTAVGVDCETIGEFDELDGVAELVLSERERVWMNGGDASFRATRFCVLWTRKEAVVKAIGGGLQIPLNGFEVLADDLRLCCEVAVLSHGQWWLASIDAPPGLAAACAAAEAFETRLRRGWPKDSMRP